MLFLQMKRIERFAEAMLDLGREIAGLVQLDNVKELSAKSRFHLLPLSGFVGPWPF